MIMICFIFSRDKSFSTQNTLNESLVPYPKATSYLYRISMRILNIGLFLSP